MIGFYHKLRRVTEALLLTFLISIPFVRIHGESAFRFDIPSLRLLFFGSEIWLADSFLILVVIIFLTFLTLFITTLFGRIWCGWLCPQTVLIDTAESIRPRAGSGAVIRIAAEAGLCLACLLIAGSFVMYFVAPWELSALFSARGTGTTIVSVSWIALAVILYLDARFLGRNFCATVCPYAKMQGVLFDERTMQIAYDTGRNAECRECEACVRSCPVHIDIRKGLQTACIHCAECADACASRMKLRGKKSLIGYSWGTPGTSSRGLRVNPLLTGIFAVLSLALLLYLVETRMPFDMSVRLASVDNSSSVQAGTMYDVSFRNMTSRDLTIELSVNSTQGTAVIEPNSVLVKKGSDLTRIKVSIRIFANQQIDSVIMTARSVPDNGSISKKVYVPTFERT